MTETERLGVEAETEAKRHAEAEASAKAEAKRREEAEAEAEAGAVWQRQRRVKKQRPETSAGQTRNHEKKQRMPCEQDVARVDQRAYTRVCL